MSGFEAEFGDKVRIHTISGRHPEGEAAVKKYNFQSHGLVPFDPQGQLIHKRRDHYGQSGRGTSDSRQPTATTASRRWDRSA